MMQKFKTIIYGSPLAIAGIYLLFSAVWIGFSDQWVLAYFDDPEQITAVQTYKGWFFITISAVVIYLLILTSNKKFYSLFDKNFETRKAFEATFEQAAVGIIHHDVNYQWLRVNKKLCEMLGYQKDEFFKIPLEQLIHPNDIEKGKSLDQELIAGKRQSYQIEKRYRRKDGTVLDAMLSKSVVRDQNGHSMFFVAALEDVTRRKQAERHLEQSYRLAQIGSWRLDLKTPTLFWSAEVKKIHEVDQDFEPDRQSFYSFIKTESRRKAFEKVLNRAVLYGSSFDEEIQIRTAAGNERWIRIIGDAEMLNGKVLYVYGSIQNVDERKKAEIRYQKLYNREKKERHRIEQLNSRLKLLDNVGNLFMESGSAFEKTLKKLAGILLEETADICSIDMMDKDSLTRVVQEVKERHKKEIVEEINQAYPGCFSSNHLVKHSMQTGEKILINHFTEADAKKIAKDEDHFQLLKKLGIRSMIILPLKTTDHILGIITLKIVNNGKEFAEDDEAFLSELADKMALHVHNITMSLELKEFNKNLEELAAERTRQLEQTNKELESFSYSVSHDLRAPLRAISGYTNLLIEDYYDKMEKEGQEFLSIVKSEVRRMGKLIDDLLAFSRLSRTGKSERVFSMEELVQECIKEVKSANSGTKPVIKLNPMENVHADPKLLRQVWVNLISNAIKYHKEEQEPEIEIGSRHDERYHRIIYYIRDNGVGFNMKYADKLFGVFQRLHSDDEFEGSGIGLALVKRIINRHGGEVWADSEVNKGSTFYFSLPLKNNH